MDPAGAATHTYDVKLSRYSAPGYSSESADRDGDGLSRAKAALSAWQADLPAPTDRPSHELADLLVCGRLVAEAALLRQESRGAHYRSDFPQPREEWRRHIIFRRRA